MGIKVIGDEFHRLYTGISKPTAYCKECGQCIQTNQSPDGGDSRIIRYHTFENSILDCPGSGTKVPTQR